MIKLLATLGIELIIPPDSVRESAAPRLSLASTADGFRRVDGAESDPDLKNIPVVTVSGIVHGGDIRRAYDLRVSALLMKPVEVEDYFAAIRSLKELWVHAASPAPKPDSAG